MKSAVLDCMQVWYQDISDIREHSKLKNNVLVEKYLKELVAEGMVRVKKRKNKRWFALNQQTT